MLSSLLFEVETIVASHQVTKMKQEKIWVGFFITNSSVFRTKGRTAKYCGWHTTSTIFRRRRGKTEECRKQQQREGESGIPWISCCSVRSVDASRPSHLFRPYLINSRNGTATVYHQHSSSNSKEVVKEKKEEGPAHSQAGGRGTNSLSSDSRLIRRH